MVNVDCAIESLLSVKAANGEPMFSLNDVARFIVAREDALLGINSDELTPASCAPTAIASSVELPTVRVEAA